MPPINYKDIKKKNTLPSVNTGTGIGGAGLNTNPLATATPTSNLPPISPALKTGSNQPGGSIGTNMINSIYNTPPPSGNNLIPDSNINNMSNLQIDTPDFGNMNISNIYGNQNAPIEKPAPDMGITSAQNAEQQASKAKADALFKERAAERAAAEALEARTILPPVSGGQEVPSYQTTDLGQQATDKFSEYALGEDPQVAAERERLERNSVLQVEQAKRDAHQFAVQQGFQPGSPQYEQIMRDRTSSARNANISATNAFQDFMRSRRSDQQREIEGIADREFQNIGTQQTRDITDFNNLVKFLPSDKSQQVLAISNSLGIPLEEAMRGMYDETGELKPEYQDKSTPELVKSAMVESFDQMNTNPDTGQPWKEGEKEAAADKLFSENFQNIIFPSSEQTGQITEQKESASRLDAALESGNYSSLTTGDWNSLTDTQLVKAKEAGHILDYDSSANTGDNWSDLDNMNTSDAKSTWLSRNPISAPENKGKIIDVDGVLYEITDPMKVVSLGGDNKRISVMARPVKGGPEKSIKDSSRFEGTTAGTLGNIIDTINPF